MFTKRESVSDELKLARASGKTTVFEAKSGWRFIDFHELWEYRDLFFFLVWRDIKVRYAQSVLGVGWAIVQPIFSMIVFTIVFGKLAKIGSEGVPYALFSYTALVPWTYFSNALSQASASLVGASGMIGKVYFPRLIIPISPVLDRLIDFCIALLTLMGLMFWFKTAPTIWCLTLPFLVFLMMLTAAGLGMWLSALAIQYRDVNHGMRFAVQLLMYASPVVYPASLIPEPYRLLYGLNPMAGVIEGFRAALLGTRPMPWDLIMVGSIVALCIVVVGTFYFRRAERVFADVA
jgi:lipopolysaccharide transport system permease protein